jgi:hypothetical protein
MHYNLDRETGTIDATSDLGYFWHAFDGGYHGQSGYMYSAFYTNDHPYETYSSVDSGFYGSFYMRYGNYEYEFNLYYNFDDEVYEAHNNQDVEGAMTVEDL